MESENNQYSEDTPVETVKLGLKINKAIFNINISIRY